MVDVHNGERTQLARFDGLIEAPNWTSDGKRLIYNRSGRLYSFDLVSRESAPIDTGFATRCNNDHVLSPDNSLIGISHKSEEDGLPRVYTVPIDGGKPTLLTPLGPSYLHGWSPDGRELAYCARRKHSGQFDIYTIPADGGVERQLTDCPGKDDGPEYSPDGKYIWFNSERSGTMQIWRMRADGGEQTQMTFEESNNWFPHVSPDGHLVAYIAYRLGDVAPGDHPANKHVEIRLMSSKEGASRTLVRLFGGQGTINVNSWAPDSVRLSFVSYLLQE
ncbi:MAG: hypothetical protein K0R75_2906 [Paenibacillaceae bacterium]|nr:hypothetical protein [Paenibacillaceae bacterium]